ncbi:S9 family peptidase [Shewanella eurypsychrophilus]|uniref:S9 family peptidase n=2 Tax=Shewanellaceae TaxID=267890 RepID=A0ABX6VGZ0_9GAMM|nr:prolyl oligopeptidase family serine peptidase [Shewanella sp. YLB-09]QPG60610.1 S9 family peptidase [Shewanella eurypsychrophilus]
MSKAEVSAYSFSAYRKSCIYLSALLCFLSFNLSAQTVEDFSRHSEYHNVKISPDGKHLAVLINTDGRKTLAFLDSKTFEVTFRLGGEAKDQVADYYWVNDERVIIQVERVRGSLAKPVSYGELFAVNFDGRKKQMIFGYRAKKPSSYGGFLLDILEGDYKHVLIRQQALSRRTDVLPEVVKLNVYSGKARKLKRAPIAYSQFLIDHDGVPRFVAGVDKNANTKLFYSKGKGEDWQAFGELFEGEFEPISFGEDNKSVYALKSDDGGPKGLYHYNLETQEETQLYRSAMVDPTYAMSSSLNEVYGLRLDEDYPNYLYLKPSSPEAKLHKALVGAFNGDSVVVSSKTRDGKQAIVHVSSDRNPGTFYLFDTETMKARHLLSARNWIKPSDMALTEPFRIKTPDGLILNGQMTLPKGKSKNLPTVVMPHGGPHARDYWGFDPQVQMLANAGYAVVQVNFRGSAGYGENFLEAGYGNWGTKIQDDILLATQYAVQQGVADKDKLCIFGVSFGGYSALQSAIREPDTFKCSIGYAGVYDLEMLYNEGDIKTTRWGDAYLDKTLGSDKAEQRAQSPVNHVSKLKAPVLIIHGEDDERAPIEHAEALKKALDKAGHPYEWLVKDKEGHGFYKEQNILEANKAILSFLDKHLGQQL